MILQENAMVDVSIAFLEIILVLCAQPSLFSENENFSAISWLKHQKIY